MKSETPSISLVGHSTLATLSIFIDGHVGGQCFIKPQFIQTIHGRRLLSSGIPAEIDFAKNPEHGATIAANMLGHGLLPGYPGEREHVIEHVDLFEWIPFDRNWKLCMTIDRENYCPTIILTEDGSIVRSRTAEHAVLPYSFPFGFTEGITPSLARRIADHMQLPAADAANLQRVLQSLYRIFVDKEAVSLEIDDLVRCSDMGQMVCMNSHFTFDDAAKRRQPDLFRLRDLEQEVDEEVEAEYHGFVYVRMDGNIGNVVNGAGLAMATNDAISHYGGKSANFLDAGGRRRPSPCCARLRLFSGMRGWRPSWSTFMAVGCLFLHGDWFLS